MDTRKRVTARIPWPVCAALEAIAARDYVSINDALVTILARALAERMPKTRKPKRRVDRSLREEVTA
jgi:hypothetical protein